MRDECDSGIVVTGSHNLKTHNGLKIVIIPPFFGEDLQILKKGKFEFKIAKATKEQSMLKMLSRLVRDFKQKTLNNLGSLKRFSLEK